MAATVTAAPAIPRTARRRLLFIALSGLMAAMAVVGFWPTYFGPLATWRWLSTSGKTRRFTPYISPVSPRS
jgi:hypothetical protein